jgi:hypothetical protein
VFLRKDSVEATVSMRRGENHQKLNNFRQQSTPISKEIVFIMKMYLQVTKRICSTSLAIPMDRILSNTITYSNHQQ